MADMYSPGWQPGQRVALNRSTILTIDKVTSSGRARIGDRTFEVGGHERGGGGYRRGKIEALTPEVEAEMALVVRGERAWAAATRALETAERWVRARRSPWERRVPEAADVERAERIARAVQEVMADGERTQ